MSKKIFTGMFVLASGIAYGVIESPKKQGVVARAEYVPMKPAMEFRSTETQEEVSQRIALLTTLWSDMYGQLCNLEDTKGAGTTHESLSESIMKLKALLNEIPLSARSKAPVRRIYIERDSILKKRHISNKLCEVLAENWPSSGSYPETGVKNRRQVSRVVSSYMGLGKITKNLFPSGLAEPKRAIVAVEVTPRVEEDQKSTSSQEQQSNSRTSISTKKPNRDQFVPESSSRGSAKTVWAPRIRSITIGAVLGLLGYLCLVKSKESSSSLELNALI